MVITTSSEKVIRRLYEITNNYDQGFDIQIKELLEMGLERLNLDIGILSRIKEGKYIVENCVVPEGVELASGVEFDFDTTYCHITCNADGPVALEHIGKDDKYASHPSYQSFGLESYIGMPIKVGGELYGTLNFSSPEPYERKFEDIDLDVLQLMASWVEVEITRRRQEKTLHSLNQELARKAYEDSLTHIPNRRAMFKYLHQELNRVSRTKDTGVLAIVDIDFFKKVNDEFGHQMGDQVLSSIAAKIEEAKRDYDYVARFGGEEFLLWLPHVNAIEAKKICTRIQAKIADVDLLNKPITVSVGIKQYDNEMARVKEIRETLDYLIDWADKALYQAKADGRDCIVNADELTSG